MSPDQKFFIFDGESVGLHGQTFAVAGGVYDVHGQAVSEFAFYTPASRADGCSDEGMRECDRDWVKKNVTLPKGEEYPNVTAIRHVFWAEWRKALDAHPGILMFVECGWPVEARFLIDCIAEHAGCRNWQGPYPMHEIATLMLAAGMDPMATYERESDELPAHEPSADARLSARLLATALAKLNLIR